MSELVGGAQLRLGAIEAPPNDVERADATLRAAARLLYAAILERQALSPRSPDYWSSSEPGAAKHAQLRRYAVTMRAMMGELASGEPLPALEDEPEEEPERGWCPAPGSLVRFEVDGARFRVIRSKPHPVEPGEWTCLVELAGGTEEGEQQWFAARKLRPAR